jgi:ribonuclease BN (tRNA processing enzyme)
MLGSHTQIELVGGIAESCHVPMLMLNHIVPGVTPLSRLRQAQQGFSGQLIISEDLMQIGVARGGNSQLLQGNALKESKQ